MYRSTDRTSRHNAIHQNLQFPYKPTAAAKRNAAAAKSLPDAPLPSPRSESPLQLSKFLCYYLLQEVTLEIARTTEEALFGKVHRQTRVKAQLNQMKGTNQICDLKELVMGLRCALGKCNQTRYRFSKRLCQQPTNGFLSSIIVNFNVPRCLELNFMHPYEVNHLRLQLAENLLQRAGSSESPKFPDSSTNTLSNLSSCDII